MRKKIPLLQPDLLRHPTAPFGLAVVKPDGLTLALDEVIGLYGNQPMVLGAALNRIIQAEDLDDLLLIQARNNPQDPHGTALSLHLVEEDGERQTEIASLYLRSQGTTTWQALGFGGSDDLWIPESTRGPTLQPARILSALIQNAAKHADNPDALARLGAEVMSDLCRHQGTPNPYTGGRIRHIASDEATPTTDHDAFAHK